MGFIIFCIAGPAIGWLVGIVVAALSEHHGNGHMSYTPSEPPQQQTEPRNEIPKDTSSPADKIDTRITNVFRNPWEGIL